MVDLRDAPETYTSVLDNTPYESKWKGLTARRPYDLAALAEANGGHIIKGTPMGNDLPVDFGLAAIAAHGLGEDELPDVLALSFSSRLWTPVWRPRHGNGGHLPEADDARSGSSTRWTTASAKAAGWPS